MEFFLGLYIGTHIGKIIADYAEKMLLAYGCLTLAECEIIDEVEEFEEDLVRHLT